MLKLKRFEHSQTDELNEFRKEFGPRNTKDSGGIIINESGLYIFYEDGEPYDKTEQVAWLKEQIRVKKFEALQSETQARQFENMNLELNKDLDEKKNEREPLSPTKKEERDRVKELDTEIKSIEARMNQNNVMAFQGDANAKLAMLTVTTLKEVLEDIEKGDLII